MDSYPHHYGSGYGIHSGYGSSGYGLGSSGLGMGSRSVRNSGFGSSRLGTPDVDIYEVGNDYIIELDLPGHSREHIDTKLYGNELHITSKPPRRSHDFHINERSLGHHDVSRRLYLPADAESNKINASLTNGVLRITIPRNATTTGLGGLSNTTIPTTTTSVLPTTGTSIHPQTTVVKDTVTTTTETKRI